MKVCPIHDVVYPDSGSCWCCDRAQAQASPDEQLNSAHTRVEKAKADLAAAENAVVTVTEHVKEQLQSAVAKAQQDAKDAAAKLAQVVGEAATDAN